MHAGALLLEPGLIESDFAELAQHGVHLVGEIGISGVQDAAAAAEMTRWAQAHGMTVTVHVGGASVPTSCTVDSQFVAKVRPDVAAHVNGGPTSPDPASVRQILEETDAALELVHNGNVKAACEVTQLLTDHSALDRLVLGTDSPAGSGVQPLGILRLVSWLSSLVGLPPEVAVACATGNTARIRRIPGGFLKVGAPADLVIADAPAGSRANNFCEALTLGDTPAVAAVLIDGDVVVAKSRNTPPPSRGGINA